MSPTTKNVSAQTKTPSPQKKTVAKKDAASDKPPAKPRKPSLKEKHSRFLAPPDFLRLSRAVSRRLSAALPPAAIDACWRELLRLECLQRSERYHNVGKGGTCGMPHPTWAAAFKQVLLDGRYCCPYCCCYSHLCPESTLAP